MSFSSPRLCKWQVQKTKVMMVIVVPRELFRGDEGFKFKFTANQRMRSHTIDEGIII